MKDIPVSAAQEIADRYGYDQVIIVGRAIGEGESVTTYGREGPNRSIAARIGDYLKHTIMEWTTRHPSPEQLPIRFQYTNWRGEKAIRSAMPITIWHGVSDWHKGAQWFLKAYDMDKGEDRDFALVDIEMIKGGDHV